MSFWHHGGGNQERFERCTQAHPCPVCGRKKFCSVGAWTVACTRVEEGSIRAGENSTGPFWVHPLSPDALARRRDLPATPRHTSTRGPASVLDRAYRAVLSRLPLDEVDRAALAGRGLDGGAILAAQYRSLTERGRSELARAAIDAVGVDLAPTVPGIVWREREDHGYWSLAGWPGLVIPVRDVEGHIVALKVRRRGNVGAHERYTWVSSTSTGGPGPGTPVHVPVLARNLRCDSKRLVITEGELKADVSTALSGVPVIGVPGVGTWPSAVEVARVWGARRVDVAFDNDARTKRAVADAQRALVAALRVAGFDVGLPRWPERFKGLDDYLAARSQGMVA